MIAFHGPIPHIVGPRLLMEGAFDVLGSAPPITRIRELLQPYSEWVDHLARQIEVLGELHLLLFALLRQVPDILPPRRALLVRNGVQVVHATTFGLIHNEPVEYRASFLKRLPVRYDGATGHERLFAAVCAFWAEHLSMCAPLVDGQVLRLEDLTRQTRAQQRAHEMLTGRSVDETWCERVGRTRVHGCVQGDDSPANLFWNVWSDSMRDMFLDLCGDSMTQLGYEIPEREAAPACPDLRPLWPQQDQPLPVGPLSPLWCFLSNPLCGPVVVLGAPRFTIVAARLLGSNGWILDHEESAMTRCRGAAQRISLADVPRLGATGVFVADLEPHDQVEETLRELLPQAEIVRMLPGVITDDGLRILEEAGPRVAKFPIPVERPVPVHRVGPVRVGDVHSSWTVVSISPTPESLFIRLSSRSGTPLELDLCVRRVQGHTPFAVAEGGLYYRRSSLAYSSIEPLCRALAGHFERALAGRSLRQALREWIETDNDPGDHP